MEGQGLVFVLFCFVYTKIAEEFYVNDRWILMNV